MARQSIRKEATSEPTPVPTPRTAPTPDEPPTPTRIGWWWVMVIVWTGAMLLLWGTELVSFIARLARGT